MDRFAALSDATRRHIVELLGAGERTAGAIGENFPICAAAVSQLLKALRVAGLVRVRVDGTRRIYSLDPDGLADMEDWFARVRAFWNQRLDVLERELGKESRDERDDK